MQAPTTQPADVYLDDGVYTALRAELLRMITDPPFDSDTEERDILKKATVYFARDAK